MLPLLRQGKLSTHSGVECRYLQCFAASSAAAKTRGIGRLEGGRVKRRRIFYNCSGGHIRQTRKPNVYLAKATLHRQTCICVSKRQYGRATDTSHSILKFAKKKTLPLLVGVFIQYRAEKKSLYVVARNFSLALPDCCLAKHTETS